jgi:hypothetical protein
VRLKIFIFTIQGSFNTLDSAIRQRKYLLFYRPPAVRINHLIYLRRELDRLAQRQGRRSVMDNILFLELSPAVVFETFLAGKILADVEFPNFLANLDGVMAE